MKNNEIIIIAHSIHKIITEDETLTVLSKNSPDLLKVPRVFIEVKPDFFGIQDSWNKDFKNLAFRQTEIYDKEIKPLIESGKYDRIVYFGAAPIPLAIHLGYLIGDFEKFDVFQQHHDTKLWDWESSETTIDINVENLPKEVFESAGDVIINFATSVAINQDEVKKIVQSPLKTLEVHPSNYGRDIIKSQVDLVELSNSFRDVLDSILNNLPNTNSIHLFAAIPVGLSFLLGTKISSTMHPRLFTYLYNKQEEVQHRVAFIIQDFHKDSISYTENEEQLAIQQGNNATKINTSNNESLLKRSRNKNIMRSVKKAKMNEVDIIIFTAIPEEFSAVTKHLVKTKNFFLENTGTFYQIGQYGNYNIAVTQTEAGNVKAATEVERGLNRFNPEYIFFVGIAGGIKDVKIGDIVVGSKVYSFEIGKEAETYKPRFEFGISDYSLTQRAKSLQIKSDWQQKIISTQHSENFESPDVYIKPIAAGEKVVANKKSKVYKLIKQNCSDALAVEMEGYGFLEAVRPHKQVSALLLRGISDLIEGKSLSDDSGSQVVASANVAAFAFAVIDLLTLMPRAEEHKTLVESFEGKNYYEINSTFSKKEISLFAAKIKSLISNNKLKEAIKDLEKFVEAKKQDLLPIVLSIKQTFDKHKKHEIAGALSLDESYIQTSKVTLKIFEVLKILEEISVKQNSDN